MVESIAKESFHHSSLAKSERPSFLRRYFPHLYIHVSARGRLSLLRTTYIHTLVKAFQICCSNQKASPCCGIGRIAGSEGFETEPMYGEGRRLLQKHDVTARVRVDTTGKLYKVGASAHSDHLLFSVRYR